MKAWFERNKYNLLITAIGVGVIFVAISAIESI